VKAIKIIGSLFTLAALLFFFVANFSAVESRYECNGKITIDGTQHPTVVFLKLQKYRWWVSLWSDSNGSAWVELPNQSSSFFGNVTKAGDQLQFWDTFGAALPSKLSGTFSSLSGALMVRLKTETVFEGACKSIQH
jgi:hypothetical protein